MDHAETGRSGLTVSRAALGTMTFGTSQHIASCDEKEAGRIIGAFLDAGGNLIDTADAYNAGESEEIVGRAIAGKRDSVVLATKAFMPQGEGPNDRGLSRVHLTRALEASLRRLGTDHIDLYQAHMWDDATPIEETMQTLDGFVRSGKVRYIGASNFTAAQIVEAQWAAARVGGVPFTALQSQYSLVMRGIEPEILPAAGRHGMGTLVYSPLGGGILSGRYTRDTAPPPGSRIDRLRNSAMPIAQTIADEFYNERNLRIAEEVAKVAAELGATPAAVALAWVRSRPGVTSVIIGARTVEQLEGNLAGFGLDLPPEAGARLDEVSWSPALTPVTGMYAPREPRPEAA